MSNHHHCGTETVLCKRRVVVVARRIVFVERSGNSGFEYALAPPVDKDYLFALVADIITHSTLKNTQLQLQHLIALYIPPTLRKRTDMQVYLEYILFFCFFLAFGFAFLRGRDMACPVAWA